MGEERAVLGRKIRREREVKGSMWMSLVATSLPVKLGLAPATDSSGRETTPKVLKLGFSGREESIRVCNRRLKRNLKSTL